MRAGCLSTVRHPLLCLHHLACNSTSILISLRSMRNHFLFDICQDICCARRFSLQLAEKMPRFVTFSEWIKIHLLNNHRRRALYSIQICFLVKNSNILKIQGKLTFVPALVEIDRATRKWNLGFCWRGKSRIEIRIHHLGVMTVDETYCAKPSGWCEYFTG